MRLVKVKERYFWRVKCVLTDAAESLDIPA